MQSGHDRARARKIASVFYRPLALFCPAYTRIGGSFVKRHRQRAARCVSSDQRGVPAAVGATTAERAAAAAATRASRPPRRATERVVRRREAQRRRATMGDAKETGGRWWEGEGAAGFNLRRTMRATTRTIIRLKVVIL